MKLLYIVNGITGSGGLERVLSIKASALADNHGCDVMIVSLDEDVRDPFFMFSGRVKLHSVNVRHRNPFRHAWAYRSQLQTVADAFMPDVICVCDDALKGFFVPLILRTQAAIVYERHSAKRIILGQTTGICRAFAKAKLRLMDVLGRKFDAFVVLSEGNRREWRLESQVIPNPVPFMPARTAAIDNQKVIAVGTQSYAKGYDMLLPTWRKVLERHPDWTLEIYGKKNPHLRLEALADKLGIAGSVKFQGAVKDIESKFLDASIFVLSSRYEGFAMVLIEAMICGLPCISFDCPHGPSDIIKHDDSGVLVPPEDIDQLSEALCTLIEDPERRRRIGAQARIEAESYSPGMIVERWMALFSELRG